MSVGGRRVYPPSLELRVFSHPDNRAAAFSPHNTQSRVTPYARAHHQKFGGIPKDLAGSSSGCFRILFPTRQLTQIVKNSISDLSKLFLNFDQAIPTCKWKRDSDASGRLVSCRNGASLLGQSQSQWVPWLVRKIWALVKEDSEMGAWPGVEGDSRC